MEFIRFGGLSKVNYKKALKSKRTFHTPPIKKGIYAFIFPYIESFLWVWKVADDIMIKYDEDRGAFHKEYRRLRKKFKYTGYIWTHFNTIAHKYGLGRRFKGSWVETHTDDLEFLLKKCKHEDAKYLYTELYTHNVPIINPYKQGLGGSMSRDHLEVFIEKVN